MKIERYYANLENYLMANKVLVIYGPRQIGKTTLLKDYLALSHYKYKFDLGDDIRIQETLGSQNASKILEYASGFELLVIDEAQKIPNIGVGLKLLVDLIPGIKIIATGSSSFELAGQIGEPLTGRKTTLNLFSVSQLELKKMFNIYEIKNNIEDYLIYGGYPEVVATSNKDAKKGLLNEITGSYLLKDILELERIKSSKLLLDLLRLLAFQIGNEVSLSELARQLGIDFKTVGRYLDLFEKSFVIYSLRGFSKNLRKEITKKCKYFFYDNGIRNAIISNFNSLDVRDDIGKLWENFLIMERLKKQQYQSIYANNFFWRTWDQQEIDFIEERDGHLFGYEFKWQKKTIKTPKGWLENYKNASFEVINRDNYLDFIA